MRLNIWQRFLNPVPPPHLPQTSPDLITVDDTDKVFWSSKTGGKGEGKATLALGDNGVLVLVDEAEHAICHSGPKGVKALLANLKAGATFLTERAAYYASDAYARAKELAEKALAAGKEGADAAAAKAGELGAHAKEAAEAAKAKAGELGAQAKEAAGAAGAKAADLAHNVADRAGETSAAVKEKAADVATAAAAQAGEVKAAVADYAK